METTINNGKNAEDAKKQIADALDADMRAVNISQAELARRSKVPQPTISRILSASSTPETKTLWNLILALGIGHLSETIASLFPNNHLPLPDRPAVIDLESPETGKEAMNLSSLLAEVNKADFARRHKFPGGASMISQHLSGHRAISLEAAIIYARGLGVDLGKISPRWAKLVEKASAVCERETSGFASSGDMKSLSERTQILIGLADNSSTKLAEIAGVSPQAVSQWLSGETKTMKSSPAALIASHFHLNVTWVANGTGQMSAGSGDREAERLYRLFADARKETQEVVRYLLRDGIHEPEWVDQDVKAYIDALQYKAHIGLSGKQKKVG